MKYSHVVFAKLIVDVKALGNRIPFIKEQLPSPKADSILEKQNGVGKKLMDERGDKEEGN